VGIVAKARKLFMRLRSRLLHLVPGSTIGSKARNLTSYYVLMLLALISVFIVVEPNNQYSLISAFVVSIFAFVYFYLVVISVILLISENFSINPVRLIRDIIISMSYTVISFAYLYKQLGIADTSVEPLREFSGTGFTYVYFSAVTFSTLGFGDFRPMPEARMVAALEALFGNLHLGIMAGAVFYLINALSKRKS